MHCFSQRASCMPCQSHPHLCVKNNWSESLDSLFKWLSKKRRLQQPSKLNFYFQGHRINQQDENGRPFFSITVIMYTGWFILMVFTNFNWGGGGKIGTIWVGEHLGGNVSFLPKSDLVMRVGKWANSAFCNPELTVRTHGFPPLDRMGLSENWILKFCSISTLTWFRSAVRGRDFTRDQVKQVVHVGLVSTSSPTVPPPQKKEHSKSIQKCLVCWIHYKCVENKGDCADKWCCSTDRNNILFLFLNSPIATNTQLWK
jgi:hypothetical protein